MFKFLEGRNRACPSRLEYLFYRFDVVLDTTNLTVLKTDTKTKELDSIGAADLIYPFSCFDSLFNMCELFMSSGGMMTLSKLRATKREPYVTQGFDYKPTRHRGCMPGQLVLFTTCHGVTDVNIARFFLVFLLRGSLPIWVYIIILQASLGPL